MADRHKECFHGMAFCRCDVSTGAKSGMPVEHRHRILPQQYPIDILSLVEDEVDSGNSDDDSSSGDSDGIRSALEAPRCEKPESPLTVSFPGPGYPKSQVPDPDDVNCIRDCDRPANWQTDEAFIRFQDHWKKRSLLSNMIQKAREENQEFRVTCTPWTIVDPEETKEGESVPSVAQMFSTPLNSPGNGKPPEPVAKSTADRPVLDAPIIASPKPPPNKRENAVVEPQTPVELQPPVVEVPPPVKCSVCLKDIHPTTEVYYQWKCLDMCAFYLHKTCLHEEMAKQGFKKKREFKDAICATEGCSAAISAISEFSMVNKESLYIKSEHEKLEKVENKKLDKLKPALAKDQKKTKKDVNMKKVKNDRDHATPETPDSNQSSVRTPEEQIEEAVIAQPVVIMPSERPVVLEEPRKHNPLTVEIDEVAVPLQKKTDELENKYTVTKQKTTFKQKTKKKKEVLDVFVPRPIRLPSGGFDDYLPASTSFNSNYVPDRWDDDRSVAASTGSQDSRSTGVLRIHDPQQFPDSIGATVTFPLPGTNSGEMFMEEILDRIAPRFDDVVINSPEHKEGANWPVHELLDAILLTSGDLLEKSQIEFIKKIFTGEDPTVLRMFIQGLKYFTVAKSGNLFTYCKNQKGRILQERFIQEQELAKVALQQQQQPVEACVPQEVPQEQKMPQQQEVPRKTPQQPVDAYVPQKQKKPQKLPQQQEMPRQETSYVPQEKPQQQTQVQLKMDGNTWNFASIIKNERGEFLVQSGHRPTWHNDSNGFNQYENNGGYYEEDQGEYVEEQEFYDAEEPVDFIPTNPRTESAVTSSSSHESSLLMDQVMAAGLSGAERERLEQQKNADMDKKIAWKMATLDLKAQMRKEEQERLSCVSEEDDWGHRDFNDNSANEEANWGNGVNSVIPPLLRSNLAPSSLSINDNTTDWHGKEPGFSFPPGFDRQPFAELSQTNQLVFKDPEPQQVPKNVVSEERYLKAMEQCQRSTEASNELEERLKAMEIQLEESYRRRDESEQKLKAVEEEKATVAAACNEKDAEVQSLNARLREQNIAKEAAEKRLRETALRHLKAEAERKLQEILSAIHHNGIIIKKVMECVGPEFAEIVEELAENHRCWETQEQIARKRLELIEAGVVEVPGLPQPPILSDKVMAFFQKAKDTGKYAYHPMMERFYKYVKNQLQRFSEIAGKEMCSSAQVQNMLTTELQTQHEKDFDVNLAVRRMASTLGYHRFKETASIPPTLRPSAPPAAKPGPAGGRSAPAAVGKKKKTSPKNVLKITAQKKNAWGPSTSATDRAVDVAEANCEICLDPMVVSETLHACALCKEPFHRQCVLAWLEKQGTCPHCRGNMPHPGHYPALR